MYLEITDIHIITVLLCYLLKLYGEIGARYPSMYIDRNRHLDSYTKTKMALSAV
jgi:hypothetical protein